MPDLKFPVRRSGTVAIRSEDRARATAVENPPTIVAISEFRTHTNKRMIFVYSKKNPSIGDGFFHYNLKYTFSYICFMVDEELCNRSVCKRTDNLDNCADNYLYSQYYD